METHRRFAAENSILKKKKKSINLEIYDIFFNKFYELFCHG